MGWTDEPVKTRDGDLFGRRGYARRVAHLIAQTHSWESSTVFGLTGPWGSGKTSLISLIQCALVDAEDTDGPVDPAYAVVWFTPWATHDVTGLFSEFFSVLTSAFPSRDLGNTARKAFANLLRIAAPAANVIPIAGSSLTEAANTAADLLVPEKPWDVAFADATAQIRASGKKILIIVDDVDRLQGNELLAVLKVVRLLGRFPGVQYLLAYDHNSLMHTLANAGASENPSAARRYIEKMIQYPIAVPALIGAQIGAIVNQQIEALVKYHRPDFRGPMNRVQDLAPTMRAILSTPRAIGRYMAQLNYEFGIHQDGETDVEDVIVLTLLRTTLPELHSQLPRYQNELVTGHKYKHPGDRSSPDEKFEINALVGELHDGDRRHAIAMVEMLFPKVRSQHGINRRKGVSQANYFGRYFTMTILDAYDIPDSRMERAVRKACGGDGEELVTLLRSEDLALALLAIDKARAAFTELLREATSSLSKDKLCTELLKTVVPILGRLGVADEFMGAVRALATSWVGADILPTISETSDPAPVIQVVQRAPDTPTKVSILLAAESSRTRRDGLWWRPVLEAVLPAVQLEFLTHLSERDRAQHEPTDLINFFIAADSARVDLAPLREGINAAINAGNFDIDDLASRFVYPDGNNGVGWNQPSFDIFAPSAPNAWYDSVEGDYPDDMHSWAGRRALAVGRIRRPQATRPSS